MQSRVKQFRTAQSRTIKARTAQSRRAQSRTAQSRTDPVLQPTAARMLLPGFMPILGFPPYDQFGIEVGVAQRLLVFYQQLNGYNVNGSYDQTTAGAAEQFQISLGLQQQEGIIDPATWSALASQATPVAAPPSQPTVPVADVVANYPYNLPTLAQQYPEDPNAYLSVAVLQSLLVCYGVLPISGTSPIDGLFGDATTAAVQSFQQAVGLSIDGVVGAQTWAALANLAVLLPNPPV